MTSELAGGRRVWHPFIRLSRTTSHEQTPHAFRTFPFRHAAARAACNCAAGVLAGAIFHVGAGIVCAAISPQCCLPKNLHGARRDAGPCHALVANSVRADSGFQVVGTYQSRAGSAHGGISFQWHDRATGQPPFSQRRIAGGLRGVAMAVVCRQRFGKFPRHEFTAGTDNFDAATSGGAAFFARAHV